MLIIHKNNKKSIALIPAAENFDILLIYIIISYWEIVIFTSEKELSRKTEQLCVKALTILHHRR